jgi:hypothetical protein
MNITLNSTQVAPQATRGVPTYFTQGSRAWANRLVHVGPNAGLHTTEISGMSYRKVGSRAPYARALYAAAMVALLSACSQTDVEPATQSTIIHSSETASDLPEVVITASRERPRTNG